MDDDEAEVREALRHAQRALVLYRRAMARERVPLPAVFGHLVSAFEAAATVTPCQGLSILAPSSEGAVSCAQAGELLGVSESTVRRLVRTGELPSARVAGRRVVRRSDIAAHLDRSAPS